MALKHSCFIKWGAAYGPKDVNALHGMVARKITGNFKVVCFTDDAPGIRSEVPCFPLPTLGCDVRTPHEHLKWIWQQCTSGKKWKRHIARNVQKADWIADHWRE